MIIETYPSSWLRRFCNTVSRDDTPHYRSSVELAIDECKKHNALGIASNQLGYCGSFIVVKCGDVFMPMINPILQKNVTRSVSLCKEGCLSFPNLYVKRKRFETVWVDYMDLNGKNMIAKFDGLEAVCVQHEIDHIQGKLFYDDVSDAELGAAIIYANVNHNMKYNLKTLRAL